MIPALALLLLARAVALEETPMALVLAAPEDLVVAVPVKAHSLVAERALPVKGTMAAKAGLPYPTTPGAAGAADPARPGSMDRLPQAPQVAATVAPRRLAGLTVLFTARAAELDLDQLARVALPDLAELVPDREALQTALRARLIKEMAAGAAEIIAEALPLDVPAEAAR